MRSFDMDRPDVTESAYTVDAGHFQYEADLFSSTHTRFGRRKSIDNYFNTANLKLGISNSLDIQLVVSSFTIQKNIVGNITREMSGFSGYTIRAKQNIWGNDRGKTALAILPFMDIPSKFLGGKVWGGLIVPFSVSLPGEWEVGAQIESDFLPDENLSGYHLSYLGSVTTSHALCKNVDFFVEGVISKENETKNIQYFANGGLEYTLCKNLIFDIGIYYGIKNASAKTYFLGMSFRL